MSCTIPEIGSVTDAMDDESAANGLAEHHKLIVDSTFIAIYQS